MTDIADAGCVRWGEFTSQVEGCHHTAWQKKSTNVNCVNGSYAEQFTINVISENVYPFRRIVVEWSNRF